MRILSHKWVENTQQEKYEGLKNVLMQMQSFFISESKRFKMQESIMTSSQFLFWVVLNFWQVATFAIKSLRLLSLYCHELRWIYQWLVVRHWE